MLLGQIIPQQGDIPPVAATAEFASYAWFIETLQLNHIVTSYWFLLLVSWLLLALIVTVYEQGMKELRRGSTYLPLPDGRYHHQRTVPIASNFSSSAPLCHQLEEVAAKEAMTLGYHLVWACNNTIDSRLLAFAKNRWSRWGGVVFHAGLAVTIASALLSTLFYNHSFCRLQEGTTLHGSSPVWERITKGPLARDLTFDFDLKLQSLQIKEWEDGHMAQLVSSVVVDNLLSTPSQTLPLAIGSPLKWHGVTFYQTWWYSYVLTCLLRGPGREQTMTYFVLNPPMGEEKEVHGGRSTLPNSDYAIEMRLYPPHGLATEGQQPTLNLKITGEAGKILFQGDVDPAQPIAIGRDTLQIVDIALWSGISVVKDVGAPMLYGGFILIVVGGIAMFLLPHREIHLFLHPQPQQVAIRCGSRSSNHDATIDDDIEALLTRIVQADIDVTR